MLDLANVIFLGKDRNTPEPEYDYANSVSSKTPYISLYIHVTVAGITRQPAIADSLH